MKIVLLTLLQATELPTVMQNIGLALLTIFIPVALFLFGKNDDQGFKVIDKALILDFLVDAKNILWKIGLIFIPMLLWDTNYSLIKILIFILWAIGVVFVIKILIKCYNWIRKGRYNYRLDYLKKINIQNEDAEDLWRSVWESTGTNTQNETAFFKIFSELIDKLLEDEDNYENIVLSSKLLNDFQIFITKRSYIFLTSRDDAFQKVLEWHFIIWQREYERLSSDNKINQYSGYSNISSILDNIIRDITKRSLGEYEPYGFFDLIDKHSKKYEKEIILNHLYLDSLLNVFYSIFFDNIEKSNKSYYIWHQYFPTNWKITATNIKESIAARITWREFINWTQNRISNFGKDKKIDLTLDKIAREIFPETEPIFWSILLTLILRGWTPDERMKSLIENPRTFGYIGRTYAFSGPINDETIEKEMDQNKKGQINNSIELAYMLFRSEISKEKLTSYISELQDIHYDKKDKLESYKNEILQYIRQILEYNSNKNK